MYYFQWRPYVPVAERRRRTMRKMQSLRKKGVDIQPVEIEGRKIAKTFWGEAWCNHLESFSDFENRLPRGRTYVRNGSVCHLAIAKGKIEAKVSGSSLYSVTVKIKTLPTAKWTHVKSRCGGQIGSLIELLQGRLSDNVMAVVTDRENGLFPLPGEITLNCSCPDWAVMCKHVAATLYGVGARLDSQPELLFKLRGVDHEELIAADAEAAVSAAVSGGTSKRLAEDSLSNVFGIDIVGGNGEDSSAAAKKNAKTKTAVKTSTANKPKKAATKAACKTSKKTTPPKAAVKKKPVKKSAKKSTVKKTAKKKAAKKAKKRPAKRVKMT